MARIPETEIERLKNEISVERLIEVAGIELKKSGKDLAGRCPYHEDDTASLVVPRQEPVALLRLWCCRWPDRLGHQEKRRIVPPRG